MTKYLEDQHFEIVPTVLIVFMVSQQTFPSFCGFWLLNVGITITRQVLALNYIILWQIQIGTSHLSHD